MQMRAAVLEEFGSPLVVQNLDIADPKAGEVLDRVKACGVCHTDLYTATGADPSGYVPCVLGHGEQGGHALAPGEPACRSDQSPDLCRRRAYRRYHGRRDTGQIRSAVDAVRNVLDIQGAVRRCNVDLSEERRIEFRVCVNVAARP